MRVEQVLGRLGGVADAATLRRFASRGRVRQAVRRGVIVRDSRGRYALPGADEATRAANRLTGVLSLDSAAQQYGWELKRQPQSPSVTVPRNRKLSEERRVGVRVRYADLAPDEIRGKVTAPGTTVMDCAARLPFDEALAIADSALRHRDVTKAQLLKLAEQMPARYRARCRRVARAADARSANPFESVLRAIAMDVVGLNLEPQVAIEDGGFWVQPDLVDERLRLVVEADSFEWHGSRRDLVLDCERYNNLVRRLWVVLRFTWEHVMFQPEYVAAVLRDIVAGQPRGRALGSESERLTA